MSPADNDGDLQTIARFGELAVLTVREFGPISGIEFGLNRPSVKWVEGFIERERARLEPGVVTEGLVNTLGSFLGESIILATGGCWRWNDRQDDWGIVLPSGTEVFPFSKIQKQFRSGLEGGDSILGFYEITVDYLAAGGPA